MQALTQAGKKAGMQTSRQSYMQEGRKRSHTGRQANKQTGKVKYIQAGKQAGKQISW